MNTLEVRGLHKAFGGVQALRDLSFTLSAGEMLALIGPNGAGKSTCFNLLNGQLAPDAGSIEFEGRSLIGLAPRAIWRLGVGRSFQVASTFASMTATENVQMALLSDARQLASPFVLAMRQHVSAAEALLERVGMLDQGARIASVLAYGDLKRLELAVALANRPRLLLLDEPTAGMGAAERVALMALVARMARESGIAVLFTEHDMDAVFTHADRILVLADGELIAQGSPASVKADPRVREAYLGPETLDA